MLLVWHLVWHHFHASIFEAVGVFVVSLLFVLGFAEEVAAVWEHLLHQLQT